MVTGVTAVTFLGESKVKVLPLLPYCYRGRVTAKHQKMHCYIATYGTNVTTVTAVTLHYKKRETGHIDRQEANHGLL